MVLTRAKVIATYAVQGVFYAFVCSIIWYGFFIIPKTPSNDRVWSLDQQILPYADITATSATIYNVRNFTYASTTEYSPNYYTASYAFEDLVSVDYIVEPFESIGAAHTFLSFGFRDGNYVTISVEIRKEIGESFSPIRGLFRTYELMYVIADERDTILLRTNHRKDVVYLYPVTAPQASLQALFKDMLQRANSLHKTPEFYNTLTNTCTTNIAKHVNKIAPNRIPFDIRLLFPENSDALAYELGLIDTSMSLPDLRKKYQINDRASNYSGTDNFSEAIRGK